MEPIAAVKGQVYEFCAELDLPDVQTLFNGGHAALVTNVGTLIQPTTRAQYLAGTTLPTNAEAFLAPGEASSPQPASPCERRLLSELGDVPVRYLPRR